MTKKCSKCGIEKSISEFNKDSKGVLGVRSDCKECRKKQYTIPKELHKSLLRDYLIICCDCGNEFKPTSNRQIRCTECKRLLGLKLCKERHEKTYIKKGYEHLRGKNANRYKTGIGIYQRIKINSMQDEILSCERCGSEDKLLVHHKDHNRENNELDNLEMVCKKCHQNEHTIRDEVTGRYI